MTPGAITFMVIFMLIVWGGLVVSALTLHRNNKKDAAAEQRAGEADSD